MGLFKRKKHKGSSSPGGGAPRVLTYLVISPASATVEEGASQQLSVSGRDQFNDPIATGAVVWDSSNDAVATVNSTGLVSGVASGSANISVAVGAINANISVTVEADVVRVLTSLVIAPSSFSKVVGQTQQLTANGFDQFGDPIATGTVTWHTSNAAKASVNSSGLVTAVAAGSANISASVGATTSNNSAATITAALVLTTISVIPTPVTVEEGATQQLTASGRDQNNDPIATGSITWDSTNDAVATVNSSGLVTGIAEGVCTITATAGGVTSNGVTVTVDVAATPEPMDYDLLISGSVTDGSTSHDTLNVSPTPGAAVFVLMSSTSDFAAASPPTVSGCGLDWEQIEAVPWTYDAAQLRCIAWKGTGTPSAGAITIANPTAMNHVLYDVVEITSVDTADLVVQTQKSSVENDDVSGVAFDDAMDAGNGALAFVMVGGGNYPSTPKTGWTEVSDHNFGGGVCQQAVCFRNTSDTSAEWDHGASNLTKDAIIIEIKSGSGGGGGGSGSDIASTNFELGHAEDFSLWSSSVVNDPTPRASGKVLLIAFADGVNWSLNRGLEFAHPKIETGIGVEADIWVGATAVPGFMKFFYVNPGLGGVQGVLAAHRDGTDLNIYWAGGGNGAQDHTFNLGQPQIETWFKLTMLMRLGTLGNADGEVEIKVNDVQTGLITGVQFKYNAGDGVTYHQIGEQAQAYDTVTPVNELRCMDNVRVFEVV